MANSGYAVPSREEALRRERWLVQRGDLSLGSMLNNMLSGGLGGILASYRQQTTEERAIARLEQQRIEIITNERMTSGEAEWLAERIARDGKVHENEKALLTFLKRESPEIHPALKDLVDRYAEAA
jgi:alkanesulfonate monooxygenase SsuD/methylene tetrahydromethanopterin reductase-like flavin-dependent oxidoreductase (luciferase family)